VAGDVSAPDLSDSGEDRSDCGQADERVEVWNERQEQRRTGEDPGRDHPQHRAEDERERDGRKEYG